MNVASRSHAFDTSTLCGVDNGNISLNLLRISSNSSWPSVLIMRLPIFITLEAAAGAFAMASLRALSAFSLSTELTGESLAHLIKGTSTHLDMYLGKMHVHKLK